MAQYRGTVKSYNALKGWGFIESPDTAAIYGKDVFVLKTALQGATQGSEVLFNVLDSHRGPQAENVIVLTAQPMASPGFVKSFAAPGGYTSTLGSRRMHESVQAVPPASQMVGVVKSYNALKGWGFVTSPEVVQMFGKDLFFMKTDLEGPVEPNQQVTFSVAEGGRGVQAQSIRPVGRATRPVPTSMLSRPPTLAPASMAMPQLAQTFAPDQCFFGAVKGYSEEKGWGHISCEAARNIFGKDIFLLRTALSGATAVPGNLVGFKVKNAPKGPQAYDVVVLPPESFEYEGQPSMRYEGTVKLYNPEKGWGFVTSQEIPRLFFGKDIFLHKQTLPEGCVPQKGEAASFCVQVTDAGKLQAKDVIISQTFAPVRNGLAPRASPY